MAAIFFVHLDFSDFAWFWRFAKGNANMQLRDMHASGVVGIVGKWGCPEVQEPSDNHHIGRAAKVQKMPRIPASSWELPQLPQFHGYFSGNMAGNSGFFWGGIFQPCKKWSKMVFNNLMNGGL